MRLLVSACLLGFNCRYDGGSNAIPEIEALMAQHICIPVCPEQMGGLPTPRPPAERQGDAIRNREGEEVTLAFQKGAEEVCRLADRYRCEAALLKERSPSCGNGFLYDGSFSKRLVKGDGLTAQALKEKGLPVYGESQIASLLNSPGQSVSDGAAPVFAEKADQTGFPWFPKRKLDHSPPLC